MTFSTTSCPFPEIGHADQQSVELQANGVSGKLDYVVGLFYYEGRGTELPERHGIQLWLQGLAVHEPSRRRLLPASEVRQQGDLRQRRIPRDRCPQDRGRGPVYEGQQIGGHDARGGVIAASQFQRWVGNHLGRLGLVQICRPADVLWVHPEWLPGRPVPGASVLPVREPQLFRGPPPTSRRPTTKWA